MEPLDPPEGSPTASFRLANAQLLSVLGRPHISDCDDSTFHLSPTSASPLDPNEDDEITPVNTTPLAIRSARHPHSAPLGPVPLPGLESAVNLWLTSHDIPPDQIPSAAALCAAVGQPAPRFLRRRLRVFRTAAAFLDIAPDDIPKEEDLRLRRAWPRVLYAIARAAASVDSDAWAAAAAAAQPALQMPDGGGWRACAVDERWEGDWVVRGMADAHGRERCTVVVAGTQGGGKTATVCQLLGRLGSTEHHALSCVPDEAEMGDEAREAARKLRHIRAVSFPTVPVEVNVPYGGANVDRTHVKVDGRMVSFVELPSMEKSVDYEDSAAAAIIAQYGRFEDVVVEVQGERVDYVVLVDRLDDLDERRLKKMLGRLRRIYGKRVLEKTVVVLTHGQGLPPADLSYEVWAFDRVRVVKEVLQKVHGERRPIHVPVVVFENSENCRKDEASGRPVLADGTDFLERFLREFRELVKRNAGSPPLDPIPTKRWWEDYVIVGCVALFTMRVF